MTLADKVRLVEDLIRENEDATIREYLDCLKEIEQVEATIQTVHRGGLKSDSVSK